MRETHHTWYQGRIPADMAERWERNVIIQKGEDFLRELLADTETLIPLAEFLGRYFDWYSSIEGFSYWTDCYGQARQNLNGRGLISRTELINRENEPQPIKKTSWKMERFELL